MIDLVATEDRIRQEVQIVADDPATAFKLRVYPGSLDELGKAYQCLVGLISFKNIDLPQVEGNKFNRSCHQQIITTNWEIKLLSVNIRDHQKIYNIACEIIQRLRGKCLLVQKADSTIQGQSPTVVTNFGFKEARDGYCYRFVIDFSMTYTDNYKIDPSCNLGI